MDLAPWFLFAHVLGAIIAFGPTFSFPIMGRFGAQEPQHSNFGTRLAQAIAKVQVLPFAILQGITGVGIIVTRNIDVMRVPWLMIAIVLYLVALGYAIFVQTPTIKKVIARTSGGPPPAPAGPAAAPLSGGPPTGGPPPAGASTGAPPSGGPPPGLMPLVRRVQMGGFFLMALIVTIVFLMVVKPSL